MPRSVDEKRIFLSVFGFIDEVSEFKKDESLTAIYTLTGKEEFLKDHFKGFPVMPGVLLLETAKQAAASLLRLSDGQGKQYRLKNAEEVRFGQFVKPGSKLKIFVRLLKNGSGTSDFDGRIDLADAPFGKALTATITLVPV